MLDREQRITPDKILEEELWSDDIFVFGSNESGLHGAGAADFAHTELGARYRQGFGRTSRKSFAIPTKDWQIASLPLPVVKLYVDRFIAYSQLDPYLHFWVTKIGCGLAGFTPEEIAPLFIGVFEQNNVSLPKEFWDILNTKNNNNGTI